MPHFGWFWIELAWVLKSFHLKCEQKGCGRAVACGKMDQISMISGLLFAWIVEDTTLSPGFWRQQRKSMCFFFSVLQGPKLAGDAGILNLWNLCPFWLFHQTTDMSQTCGIDRNWWYWRRLQHWNLAGKQKQACCDNGVCVACLLSTHQHGYAMRVAYGDVLIQLRCLQ